MIGVQNELFSELHGQVGLPCSELPNREGGGLGGTPGAASLGPAGKGQAIKNDIHPNRFGTTGKLCPWILIVAPESPGQPAGSLWVSCTLGYSPEGNHPDIVRGPDTGCIA